MAGLSHADTFIVDVPTIRPHVLAMATMHAQSMVIVRLTDADGIEGIGEGTTIGGLSYGEESPEGIKLAIDTYIAPVLKTCDPAQVGAAIARVGKSVFGNHIAKCAVETALLDMAGKRLGVPVSTLIGGGAVRDRLPIAWTLASGTGGGSAKYAEPRRPSSSPVKCTRMMLRLAGARVRRAASASTAAGERRRVSDSACRA